MKGKRPGAVAPWPGEKYTTRYLVSFAIILLNRNAKLCSHCILSEQLFLLDPCTDCV